MTSWYLTHRADKRAAALADRHYSRQTPGSKQFMPPGRALILVTENYDALWGTSFPYPQYVLREWKDAWLCSLFRNESSILSSELILEAVAVTRWRYGNPSPSGMITMIDTEKVRHKRDPGRCYRKAGFSPIGYTKNGLLVLQLLPNAMPPSAMPYGATLSLFEEVTA